MSSSTFSQLWLVRWRATHSSDSSSKMGDTRFANLKIRTSHKSIFGAFLKNICSMCFISFYPLNLQVWNDEMVVDLNGREKIAKKSLHFAWWFFIVFSSASTCDADQYVILVKLIRHVILYFLQTSLNFFSDMISGRVLKKKLKQERLKHLKTNEISGNLIFKQHRSAIAQQTLGFNFLLSSSLSTLIVDEFLKSDSKFSLKWLHIKFFNDSSDVDCASSWNAFNFTIPPRAHEKGTSFLTVFM